ncbi:MAG: tetratricopeptide repeat protein [Planctomycetota bacterium]|nr:MAG: tetratricopeptide repeat protein [Planctomycetota bacterium]
MEASEKAADRKTQEAIEILKLGLEIFPKEAQLYSLMGDVLVDLKDWKGAKKNYLQALQYEQKDEKLYIALANLYHQMRKPEEEVKVYKMALQALPKSSLLYAKIAQAYLYNGNFAESLQALKKALALDKSNKAAIRLYQKREAIKEFGKGVGLFKKKKFKEAIEIFEKIQAQLSHIPLLPYYKGVCHYMLRQFDEAIGNLEKYLHLDAHGPKTKNTISFIKKAIKEVQEIDVNLLLHPLDKCHLVIKSNPKNAQVYLDDQLVGNTPLNLLDQPAGSHFLRIEKDGKKIEIPTIFSGGIAYKIHFQLDKEDCQIEPSLDYELIES